MTQHRSMTGSALPAAACPHCPMPHRPGLPRALRPKCGAPPDDTTPAHTSRRAASWASISGDGCVHGRSWGTRTPKAPVEDEALILGPAPIGAARTCAAVGFTCHSYMLAHQSPGEYAASPAQGAGADARAAGSGASTASLTSNASDASDGGMP